MNARRKNRKWEHGDPRAPAQKWCVEREQVGLEKRVMWKRRKIGCSRGIWRRSGSRLLWQQGGGTNQAEHVAVTRRQDRSTEREIRDPYAPEHCAACGGNLFECGCRDVDFESKSEKRRREKERREKNEGLNPEEVVEDNAMDLEWEKGSESANSSGGGEWARWSGAWWVKTKMRMNSANRRKVHRAISQSLGKSSERSRVCEEKISDTDDDGARRRQKLEEEIDLKRSWRARNEQASAEEETTNFRKASKAEGACVDTPGYSCGFQILNKDVQSWPGTCCPGTRAVCH